MAEKKSSSTSSGSSGSSSRSRSEDRPQAGSSSSSSGGTAAPRAESPRRQGPLQIGRSAAGQLLELTGKAAEGVTGMTRTEDGWSVQVEVVEVRRIPDTTDVLALYELDVDERGDLQGYRRIRRYVRGTPGDD